jgi:hypothetical protein
MFSMKLKILSWNMRELNDTDKWLRIRNLLKIWGPDIIYLQETKMDLITRGVVRSIWGINHFDWLYLGTVGALGGILLMWDTRVVEKVDEPVGHFFCVMQVLFNY